MSEDNVGVEVDATEAEKISFTPEPVAQISQSKGILKSATTRTGGTVANRAVQDSDLVRVRGIELSVEQAVNGGFLSRNAAGEVVDVDDAAVQRALSGGREADEERKRAEAEAAAQEYAVGMEPENAQAMSGIVKEIEQAGVNPASAIQAFIGDPSKLPDALEQVARASGRDSVAMLQQVQTLARDMTTGVEDLLITKGNFDAAQLADFWEWARSNRQLELRSAALSAILRADGRGYLHLAEKYQQTYGMGRGVSRYPVTTVKVGT